MGKLIDLTGQRFGKLVVTGRAPDTKPRDSARWFCVCDCGGRTEAYSNHLRRGLVPQCRACKGALISQLKTTHGGTNTRLFRLWKGMKDRCGNPRNKSYPLYGGKGVRVCIEWSADFAAFREWACANGYTDSMTIERRDSTGHYTPSNCEWITKSENSRRAMANRWKGKQHGA